MSIPRAAQLGFIFMFAVCASRLSAEPPSTAAELLIQRVEDFSVQDQDARTVLEGIGSSYRFPIIIEPDVQGKVSFEVHNTTVETVLEAICEPHGWSFTASGGCLFVRRFVTRIYPVDYLQLTQSGSSSTSVNLSETPGVSAGSAQLLGSVPLSAPLSQASNTGGTSSLSVSEHNDTDFWGRLEADLKAMVGEGELLIVNRFAGVVQLRGSLRSQAVVEAYLRRVLERAGRQARISVKVVEVDLNDQSKTGIDWTAASLAMGNLAGTAVTIPSISTSTGPITQVGSVTLNPDTFSAVIGAGKVQAAISALSDQGNVRIESKPEIAALNNQTAFVQVSEDQPFFSRTNTTTINAGATSQSGYEPITNTNYVQSTVSFGNVLEITVQIADDLSTKLSLSPAMTELKGTVTSPDGLETAPVTGTKRARTTVTLRNHETAVIGGFITESESTDRRGLPGLSDLPVIGRAFSTSGKAKVRTELVFFVTVNVERPPTLVSEEVEQAPRGPGPARAPSGTVERVGIDTTFSLQ